MSGVLVLGSLNVDHILRVAGLPRPGETVLSQAYSIVPGGKGRNQATAVAALGGRAGMAGAGDTFAGALALALAEGGRLAGAMPDAMAAAAAFLAGELSAARVHEIRAAGGP